MGYTAVAGLGRNAPSVVIIVINSPDFQEMNTKMTNTGKNYRRTSGTGELEVERFVESGV